MASVWRMSPSRGHVIRLLAMVVFAGSGMPAAGETLYLGKLAAYANPARVRAQVREECTPEITLPAALREEMLRRTAIQEVEFTDNLPMVTNGLAMTVAIVSLDIPPGTGWNSAKRSLRVKTILYRDGVVVAQTDLDADSRGAGNFVQKVFRIRKSCDYLERLIRDVSRNTVERMKLLKALPTTVATQSETE